MIRIIIVWQRNVSFRAFEKLKHKGAEENGEKKVNGTTRVCNIAEKYDGG